MNIARNERLLEKLAAEYVLGTLRGGARRRYEDWLRADPVVQRVTAQWQDRLHPMAELAPAVTPPDTVWRGLAQRLDLPAPATAANARRPAARPERDRLAFWRGLRDDLGFWRGLGMASTAVATILVAVLAARAPEPARPVASYVAMLNDDQARAVAVVTGDAVHHTLAVRVVLPQTIAADRSLQLWAVPASGAPRSLGLVGSDGTVTLPLPAGDAPQAVPLLAISLEPKGGSPNPNGPTGPIVYKGAWVAL